MLVKHDFGHRIGRSIEPSLGFRLDARQCSVQGRVRAADLNAIDPDGDDRARANIGAAPLLVATIERFANAELVVSHGQSDFEGDPIKQFGRVDDAHRAA